MAETRRQVKEAKEQSVRLFNLEQEVVNLRLERDKYMRFWLEVKVKAKTAKAELRKKSRQTVCVSFTNVPPILDRDRYKRLLLSSKKKVKEVQQVNSGA